TRRERAVRRPTRHPAVAALALDKPPLRIEGRAVAFAGILAQQLGFFTWLDAIEFRLPYIDEIIEPVRMIERPFGEGETGIEPLHVTIDQVVERGHVDLLTAGNPATRHGNGAKTTGDTKAQFSRNTALSGLRPSASIAPGKQNQFSTSCWPLSSIWLVL